MEESDSPPVSVEFELSDRIIRGRIGKELESLRDSIEKVFRAEFSSAIITELSEVEYLKPVNIRPSLSETNPSLSVMSFHQTPGFGGFFYATDSIPGWEDEFKQRLITKGLWSSVNSSLNDFFGKFDCNLVEVSKLCDVPGGLKALKIGEGDTCLSVQFKILFSDNDPISLVFIFDYAIFFSIKSNANGKLIGQIPKNHSERVLGNGLIACELIAGFTWLSRSEIATLELGSMIKLDQLASGLGDLRLDGKLSYKAKVLIIGDNFGCELIERVEHKEVCYNGHQEAKVMFGTAVLSPVEASKLELGLSMVLDELADSHLPLVVDGEVFCKGELQIVGDHLAFRVTEMCRSEVKRVA